MRRLFGTLALAAAVVIVAAFAATASPAAQASWWSNVTKIANHIKYNHNFLHLASNPDGPWGNNGQSGDIVVIPTDGVRPQGPIDDYEPGDEIWACVEDWCFGEIDEENDAIIPRRGWVRVLFRPLFRPLFGDVLFTDTPDQVTSESTDFYELVTWVVAGNPASAFNICTYYEWLSSQ